MGQLLYCKRKKRETEARQTPFGGEKALASLESGAECKSGRNEALGFQGVGEGTGKSHLKGCGELI